MISLFDLIIAPERSLQTALERMTVNKKGLLFVCDENEHLIGVISDGDIRRALLNNALLLSSISSYMNLDPITTTSIESGKALINKTNHIAIPVVNDLGQVIAAVIQNKEEIEVIKTEQLRETITSADVIAIIPARGGSKRIVKKNIAVVKGKPLIGYAIEVAKLVSSISEVLISTDDEEIANIARVYGADVPWLRPAHLAQDDTPSIDVVIHSVEWAKKQFGSQLQFGVLLEPTAPLRTSEQISKAIEILRSSDADSVVSVSEIPHVFNPEEILTIKDQFLIPFNKKRTMDNRLPRQSQKPYYAQNGLVYAFRIDRLLEKRSLYGKKCSPMIVDWSYFLDIDNPSDLILAEHKINVLSNNHEGEKKWPV